MIAATTLAIFVVPVLFVLITKLSYGRKLKKIEKERLDEEDVDRSILQSGT
jgi:HAE1 family hydrophobic/amphiphilic exporter-1